MPTKINLLGQKYGRLTVIQAAENINGRTAWLCQCDCGKTKIITTQLLRRGLTKSCGCLKTEKSGIQIGDIFDNLTVIEKTDKRLGDAILWVCKCKCGNIVKKSTTYLHRDFFKSCGCFSENFITELNKKDLTNQRFGKLIALEPTEARGSGGCVIWKCKCDCGNEVYLETNRLTSGNTSSCGCITASIGEQNIKTILINNNIIFKSEYTNQDLKLKRFDFALFDANNNIIRFIEFDGEQHYNSNDKWDNYETFESRHKRDQEKNQYAKDHNIPLVRIPYWERDNITLEMLMSDKYLV